MLTHRKSPISDIRFMMSEMGYFVSGCRYFRMMSSWAQRKIPVDLHFIVRLRHKASGSALGPSCVVCFEQPAGVFAGCGAVCQAKILASLKIKNGISLTPLN